MFPESSEECTRCWHTYLNSINKLPAPKGTVFPLIKKIRQSGNSGPYEGGGGIVTLWGELESGDLAMSNLVSNFEGYRKDRRGDLGSANSQSRR